MDEPTAALGVKETAQVLDLIEQLHGQGVTVVIISHNMEHVLAVAGRVAILKQGTKVGECLTEGLTAKDPGHHGHDRADGRPESDPGRGLKQATEIRSGYNECVGSGPHPRPDKRKVSGAALTISGSAYAGGQGGPAQKGRGRSRYGKGGNPGE